jgi:hypothetical protein
MDIAQYKDRRYFHEGCTYHRHKRNDSQVNETDEIDNGDTESKSSANGFCEQFD